MSADVHSLRRWDEQLHGHDEEEQDEGAHQIGLEHLVPHLGKLGENMEG